MRDEPSNALSGCCPREFLVENWLVQPQLNALVRDHETTRLEPKAMQVLVYLAERPGEVVSKERLMGAVWADTFVGDQVLANAIWQLRSILGRNSIQTIPKAGYRLVAQVSACPLTQGDQSPIAPLAQSEQQIPTDVERPVASAKAERQRTRNRTWMWLAAASVVLTLAVVVFTMYVNTPPRPYTKPRLTIAVLPFLNLSGDPAQEYFVDGITDGMIFQLGVLQPERLAVIARGSAMAYKGSRERLDQIGRELGVDYIVEGSIRREDRRVHVRTQLVEAATQTQVWGQDVDRDVNEVALLEREISRTIAQQIRLRLTPEQNARLDRIQATSQPAYDAYLKGRYSWEKRNKESIYRAIEYFEQAARLDPSFAAAYAAIADSYWALYSDESLSNFEASAKAKPAIAKALQLDSSSAEAHAARGIAAMEYDWDWTVAEAEFKRAIALNPNYAWAHAWYAVYLSLVLQQHDDGIAEMRLAQRLDPVSPTTQRTLTYLYMFAGRYDQAVVECRKLSQLEPGFLGGIHECMADVYVQKGEIDTALAEIAGLDQSYEYPVAWSLRILAKVKTGDTAGAQRLVSRASSLIANKAGADLHNALLYASAGDKDKAFVYLEKAFQARARGMIEIRVYPELAALRSDPRFANLLARMNLK